MQEFKKYHYDSAVLDQFNPRGLVIAKSRMSTKAGPIHAPERLPAGKLFAGRTLLPVANGTQLFEGGVPVAFIEDSSNDGSKYRFYNHPDKTKATVTLCLVEGDPTIELVEVNPCFTVEPKANGLVTIHNTSIINGKPWQEFDPVAYASRIGWMYSLNNLQEAKSFSGLIYLPEGGDNFNQAGSRREYINLTRNPDLPKATDMDGNSQIDTHYDYLVKEVDLLDSNIELFGMKLVWLDHMNPKNEDHTFHVELNDLEGFENE